MQKKSPHEEFVLKGGNTDAVVFVHGIGGSPIQFRQLAEFMFGMGYDCAALLLPGHGSDGSAFSRTQKGAWKDHITKFINHIATEYHHIYLVGHSLGELLCLEYATNHPVAGLVLINTPMAIKISLKQLSINLHVALAAPDRDNEILAAYRSGTGITGGCKWYEYPLMPRPFIYLLRQMRNTAKLLGNVRTRSLIVQSGRDETVRQKSARLLQTGLVYGNPQELKLMNSYHSYFPTEDQQTLQKTLFRFVKECSNA